MFEIIQTRISTDLPQLLRIFIKTLLKPINSSNNLNKQMYGHYSWASNVKNIILYKSCNENGKNFIFIIISFDFVKFLSE